VNLTEQERIEEMRRGAQEELARANRIATVGAFSASIAHELNQPITSMVLDSRTGLRWLQGDKPNVEGAIGRLEQLLRTADRVAAIVQRTRESIVAGRRNIQTVNFRQLVSETRELLEPDMRRANVHFEAVCKSDIALVQADPVELQQVLINLIGNAIDAMRDQTTERKVTLSATAEADALRVVLADTGPGIAAEHLDKLFDPFFTTKPTGIGMGLQICRSAIESMGGELTVVNLDGGGASFTFTLPLVTVN